MSNAIHIDPKSLTSSDTIRLARLWLRYSGHPVSLHTIAHRVMRIPSPSRMQAWVEGEGHLTEHEETTLVAELCRHGFNPKALANPNTRLLEATEVQLAYFFDGKRDDLRIVRQATHKGWTPQLSTSDTLYGRVTLGMVPGDGLSFRKGERICWYTSRGWKTARNVGYHINSKGQPDWETITDHQYYPSLETALNAY